MEDTRRNHTLSEIIKFYREQLEKFYKIGIGNKTEFRTVVTDNLIDATKRRLLELKAKKFNLGEGFSRNGTKWLSLYSLYDCQR